MQLALERPPLALIACGDDWMSRALESVFQQHAFTPEGVQAIQDLLNRGLEFQHACLKGRRLVSSGQRLFQ